MLILVVAFRVISMFISVDVFLERTFLQNLFEFHEFWDFLCAASVKQRES
jgi:hypothetical protein